MKKLLVLMLVLVLVGITNAAILDLSIGGVRNGIGVLQEITIGPSDSFVVDVYNSSPGPISDQFWLGIETVGTAPPGGTGATNSALGEWIRSTMTHPNPASGNASVADDGTQFAWPMGVKWWAFDTGFYGLEPGQFPVVGTWFTCEFHCVAPGDLYINLYDAAGAVIKDQILVHQIPEPVTIVLLSLGGLLLRKK